MKTIAIHSHKGGVGKTTLALLLAKYAAQERKKVVMIDYDFLGAGMGDLLKLGKAPVTYLENYLLQTERDLKLSDLVTPYSDRDIEPNSIMLLLNSMVGLPKKLRAREHASLNRNMHGMMGDDYHFGEIDFKTKALLEKLEEEEKPDLTIIDCHPGLTFVSRAAMDLADLNIYVITPNRTASFGFLKQFNMDELKEEKVFLLLNMADGVEVDAASFRETMKDDEIVGGYARPLFARFETLCKDDSAFCAIPENPVIFRWYAQLGGNGLLPKIDLEQEAFSFCHKILTKMEGHSTNAP